MRKGTAAVLPEDILRAGAQDHIRRAYSDIQEAIARLMGARAIVESRIEAMDFQITTIKDDLEAAERGGVASG